MKAKKKLNFIDRLILWINIFLSAALLVSYLSPITNPAKFWLVAFFGLAYPMLLLVNLVLVGYWLLRKSIWVLLPLICIGVGWNVLNNNVGFHFSVKDDPPRDLNTLRMMTYNVHNFKRYGSKNDVSTKHEILELISKEHPDIIGFQEFYSRKRGQYNMCDSVKKVLNCDYYYFEPFEFNSTEAIGMAIFSKFPIISNGLIHLSDIRGSGNQCLFVDVKKGAKIFRVYSVHLQSIRFDPEDYKYLSRVSQQGKPDISSTKRLGSKLKTAFIQRSKQVFIIKDHAARCPYPYIISGDFNDTPASFAVNQMAQGLNNAFRATGFGLGRTYNGDFPNYQIDYIMTSRPFHILNYHIVERKLSDHYPLRSDLELN